MWVQNRMPMTAIRAPALGWGAVGTRLVSQNDWHAAAQHNAHDSQQEPCDELCAAADTTVEGKGALVVRESSESKGEHVGETQEVHDRYQGACVLIIGLASDRHFAHPTRTCRPATRIMASKHHQSAQIIAREGSATRRYCPTPAVLATADQDQDQWRPLVPTTLWRCVLCLPGWL